MNMLKKFFKDWSLFEKLWLLFVITVQVVAWILNKDTIFMLILTLTGSLNLVLGAKGKIAGLYFAIINSVLYAWSCMKIPLYGEVMYNVLYSIPVSATAIFMWKKNKTSDGEVKFRTMSLKLGAIIVLATIAGTFGYAEILKLMGGNFAFMDSLTTVVAVVASMLYLLRFSEQWLMWVLVNALSIIMWVMVFASGDKTVFMIIILKSINLLNSLYGYINWKRISKRISKNTETINNETIKDTSI
ncbi:nicotinamide riboside transporter PnuC [Brachyspira pilosicoli]|uniref:nicotinamide riboside transporter PnuC n=1 Tax=Brachyspira pilosicoli TaxID=52584 RepID=UPI00255CF24B|nr:nicotinamide riboside transporter PnuC [Brachyspira pilosicoli]